jgi:hypothetical protein
MLLSLSEYAIQFFLFFSFRHLIWSLRKKPKGFQLKKIAIKTYYAYKLVDASI